MVRGWFSTQVLWRAFEYAQRLGLRVFVRPGEHELEHHATARFSDWSVVHGLPSVIAESEEMGVYRIAALARQSGASVHLNPPVNKTWCRCCENSAP